MNKSDFLGLHFHCELPDCSLPQAQVRIHQQLRMAALSLVALGQLVLKLLMKNACSAKQMRPLYQRIWNISKYKSAVEDDEVMSLTCGHLTD